MNNTVFERLLSSMGDAWIAGTDEAGRGPMAGPLVVAAVILPEGYTHPEMDDSKRLTAKKREKLYDVIIDDAISYCIVVIEPDEIDQINIYEASRRGMVEAVKALQPSPQVVLTDAMPLREKGIADIALIKGDHKSISIAAASILAKVYRDRLMDDYDALYPEYGFKKHKGYVTKVHKEALKKYGPCPIHRQSYRPVQEVLQKQISFFEET